MKWIMDKVAFVVTDGLLEVEACGDTNELPVKVVRKRNDRNQEVFSHYVDANGVPLTGSVDRVVFKNGKALGSTVLVARTVSDEEYANYRKALLARAGRG